jgi:hypothetical protein
MSGMVFSMPELADLFDYVLAWPSSEDPAMPRYFAAKL